MFLRGKIYQAPVLEETMDSNNTADVSHQISPAVSRRQIFFYILSPHPDYRITVVFIELAVFGTE